LACAAVHSAIYDRMIGAEAVVAKAAFPEKPMVEAMWSGNFACHSAGVSAGIRDPDEDLKQNLLCYMNPGK
jgi:hypothetical protein